MHAMYVSQHPLLLGKKSFVECLLLCRVLIVELLPSVLFHARSTESATTKLTKKFGATALKQNVVQEPFE